MSKHTPWSEIYRAGNEHYIADSKERVVCAFSGDSSPEDRAHARLIAAAPEMLDALNQVLNSDMAMREEDEGRSSDLLELVRELIEKAETK